MPQASGLKAYRSVHPRPAVWENRPPVPGMGVLAGLNARQRYPQSTALRLAERGRSTQERMTIQCTAIGSRGTSAMIRQHRPFNSLRTSSGAQVTRSSTWAPVLPWQVHHCCLHTYLYIMPTLGVVMQADTSPTRRPPITKEVKRWTPAQPCTLTPKGTDIQKRRFWCLRLYLPCHDALCTVPHSAQHALQRAGHCSMACQNAWTCLMHLAACRERASADQPRAGAAGYIRQAAHPLCAALRFSKI